MSVVIVGGHDRMVTQYKKICKEYHCKAKVFTHMCANMSNQIGRPDLVIIPGTKSTIEDLLWMRSCGLEAAVKKLVILFTNTVSHKMVHCALAEANKGKADVVRCHTSSSSALHEILKNACCSA